jgi:hypothetical protein
MSEYLPIKRPSITSKNREERKLARLLRNYTYKFSGSYDSEFNAEIRVLQPGWFTTIIPTPIENKKKLMELAGSGAKRPSSSSKNREEKRLAVALKGYTDKHRSGDQDFCVRIRALRPDWFDRSAINKNKILELAKTGKPRPGVGLHSDILERRLYDRFIDYTVKGGTGYDLDFTKRLQLIRPDWFEDKVALRKDVLLKLAASGAKKPDRYSKDLEEKKLSYLLGALTQNGKRYDRDFSRRIHILRPDWFEVLKDIRKLKLLELAKSGADKPRYITDDMEEKRMLITFYYCTNKRSKIYDFNFDKQLRVIRPDWFANAIERNKANLITLAKSGAKRPTRRSGKLGSALCYYIDKNHARYDPDFDKQIHTIRPEWFISTSTAVKAKLFDMAICGSNRPNKRSVNQAEKKLGHALAYYTCGRHFDPDFTKQIRVIRPDWFQS